MSRGLATNFENSPKLDTVRHKRTPPALTGSGAGEGGRGIYRTRGRAEWLARRVVLFAYLVTGDIEKEAKGHSADDEPKDAVQQQDQAKVIHHLPRFRRVGRAAWGGRGLR